MPYVQNGFICIKNYLAPQLKSPDKWCQKKLFTLITKQKWLLQSRADFPLAFSGEETRLLSSIGHKKCPKEEKHWNSNEKQGGGSAKVGGFH